MCPYSDEPSPRPEAGERDRALERLGPPGFGEFAAARRRFEETLALQCLERAFAAPEYRAAPQGLST